MVDIIINEMTVAKALRAAADSAANWKSKAESLCKDEYTCPKTGFD